MSAQASSLPSVLGWADTSPEYSSPSCSCARPRQHVRRAGQATTSQHSVQSQSRPRLKAK